MPLEAYNLLPELRRNKLGLRFLYELRSSTTYKKILNTLDDREVQNFKENKEAARPIGVYLRKLEQKDMKEQREMEENHMTQQPSDY